MDSYFATIAKRAGTSRKRKKVGRSIRSPRSSTAIGSLCGSWSEAVSAMNVVAKRDGTGARRNWMTSVATTGVRGSAVASLERNAVTEAR